MDFIAQSITAILPESFGFAQDKLRERLSSAVEGRVSGIRLAALQTALQLRSSKGNRRFVQREDFY
jgi:hypothetical protein